MEPAGMTAEAPALSMELPPTYPELSVGQLNAFGRRTAWRALVGDSEFQYTYSGRAAIYQYLCRLRSQGGAQSTRQVVLVPSFHCPSVVDPVLHAGYEVRFYTITADMRIDRDDFLHKLDERVCAALFIRYFGFSEADRSLIAACRTANVVIVEDCSHSFLSANPLRLAFAEADAAIYSFWKLIPSLIGGGVLLGAPGSGAWPQTHSAGVRNSLARMRTLMGQLLDGVRSLKRKAAVPGDTVPVPVERKQYEEAYPYDRDASSWEMPLSARFVLEGVDLQRVALLRREHYRILAGALVPHSALRPLRAQLDEDTCPWGFPVLLERRAERDYLLRARGVPVFTFGEVLHPLLVEQHPRNSPIVESATYLSNTVLGFAVHQNLTAAQVSIAGRIINEFVSRL